MLTIYPDGGVKRIRVFGTQGIGTPSQSRVLTSNESETPTTGKKQGECSRGCDAIVWRLFSDSADTQGAVLRSGKVKTLRALPLSPEAFAAFGQVIQGYEDLSAVPRGVRVTAANQGSANKFHKISLLDSSYPENVQATAGLSVYRCQPIDAKPGGHWDIKVLERHLHTNQAFIPMGPGSSREGDHGLREAAESYLVVVSQNGKDDRPDLETMRAFVATSAQGIVYNAGIWRKSHQTFFTPNKVEHYDQITPWRF